MKTQSVKQSLRLNYPQTFLIGFGFLASSLAWAIYNSQVPLILSERFLISNTLIGTIMTIDNFFGVIFQPLIGAWSDNTRTRIGRRMPWIAIGLPICAILFALIPLQQTLVYFMGAIIAFNLIMALWRSPVISLMPDVTPAPLRSEANGIINMMGGVGSIVAFFFGGLLSDLRDDKFFAFLLATVIMLLALVVLLTFVREPDAIRFKEQQSIPIRDSLANRWGQRSRVNMKSHHEEEDTFEKQRSLTAFLTLPRDYKISLVALLIAIFTWFMGYNAIETFFTLYATNTYGISGGQATMMLTGFSLTFLIFAIPAGLLGQKIGRKKTISIGLIGIVVCFLPILTEPSQWLVQALLIAGGACWACININSLPMVVEFATERTIGSFTGYYYLFSFTAAIVSPITYGAIQDYFQTNELLFLFAVLCFGTALVSMIFVKHGDNKEMVKTK
ncbi:SLC45 family MFS transporter [Alkalibacterium iburiense]|uniref:SLC45 family MFS transporter n=1 Tax=Alkalibacterium iburiense TaxID=290589 RepID=A0ABN0X4P1_9LACT